MAAAKKLVLSFLFFLMSVSPVVFCAVDTAALSADYLERVPARFGHGFMNTVFGWTDLGLAPYHAMQDGLGAGDAFGRALTQPFGTTFLGVWDLATFWVPGECGRSMAVPRHVWMPSSGRLAPAAPSSAMEAAALPEA